MSEYLKRELIANVRYVINNDNIKIENDNTSWVNINRIKPFNKVYYHCINRLTD